MEDNKDTQDPAVAQPEETQAQPEETPVLPKEVTDTVAISDSGVVSGAPTTEPEQTGDESEVQPDAAVASVSPLEEPAPSEAESEAPLEQNSVQAPSPDTVVDDAPKADNKLLASVVPEEPKGGKKHIMVVVVALIVMLSLICAAVYVYLQASTEPITTTTEQQSTLTELKTETNSPASIDEVDAEIDKSLEALDSAADLDDTDLSDESLGL
jgi:hypothetical protein